MAVLVLMLHIRLVTRSVITVCYRRCLPPLAISTLGLCLGFVQSYLLGTKKSQSDENAMTMPPVQKQCGTAHPVRV